MAGPYTDHHLHVMSTVAARLSVDVSPAASLGEMGRIVAGAAPEKSAGWGKGAGWVRAWGYEEWALAEGRHPSRQDLDRMLVDRPLLLHHRTGHAVVANSAALLELGEPDHPDGILVDRHDLLSRAPRLEAGAMEEAATVVSREWEAAGVTAVVDATHTNGPADLETLASWRARGVLRQDVTAMVAARHAASVPPYGQSVGRVRVGPVKLMPSPGRVSGLAGEVAAAHRAGFPVAVHVVEVDTLEATLEAFEASPPPAGTSDRIEHNALCLPEQVSRIASTGAVVVVNPGFLVHRRGKYDAELSPVERPWLVRIGSLVRAGVVVRAGSDSPVGPSRPADVIAGATAHPYAPEESVTAAQAEALLGPVQLLRPGAPPSG